MNKKTNGFPALQENAQFRLLDHQLDEWLNNNADRIGEDEGSVYDPIVCSKYNANKHQAIIDTNGRIRFASQLLTITLLEDIESASGRHADILQDVNTFEVFTFEYPETVRRIKKQVGIVSKREARFTETRLDFRSPNLPKYHPMNAVCISHMYSFHDYINTSQARMNIGRQLLTTESWSALYPEYEQMLLDTRQWMKKAHGEFFEATKDWIWWELTTLPWGNQFDDIFDTELTAASAAAFPDDSDFFVK